MSCPYQRLLVGEDAEATCVCKNPNKGNSPQDCAFYKDSTESMCALLHAERNENLKTYQTHDIKLREEYADAVLSGEKNFEIRYNDRGYQKGDTVIFKVVDKDYNRVAHPLTGLPFVITYIIHGFGLKENWCVFGIKRKEEDTW